jgi:ubiquinone/menaquinone biosynthesis C-methylase UbiE
MNDKVKEYWDGQAKEFGISDMATAPDHYYRQKEIAEIIALLRDGDSILDVGCGNGFSTFKFAEACPSSSIIIGLDYSEPMIEAAKLARGGECRPTFGIANVLDLTINNLPPIDTVICTRCLINLDTWYQQKDAILQIKAVLKPGGRLILVENTLEGLVNLNNMRRHLDLPIIEQRWHNHYLPQQWLEQFLAEHFTIELAENIGSTYYLVSRVVYAKLCQLKGEEPQYLHPINEIAAQLPNSGNCSPNMLYALASI